MLSFVVGFSCCPARRWPLGGRVFDFVGTFRRGVASAVPPEPHRAAHFQFLRLTRGSLPLSAKLGRTERLHRLICTRPRLRKKPGPRSCNYNWAVYDVHRPSLCKSTFASTSSDHTAVARKILTEEIAFRRRTRRESAAAGRSAARPCRAGLRARAWSEPCGRELSSPAARQRRVGSAPRADVLCRLGRAALCSRLALHAGCFATRGLRDETGR